MIAEVEETGAHLSVELAIVESGIVAQVGAAAGILACHHMAAAAEAVIVAGSIEHKKTDRTSDGLAAVPVVM